MNLLNKNLLIKIFINISVIFSVIITVLQYYIYFNRPKFGKVIPLTSHDFVENIDKEQSQVTVIIHLYEDVSHYILIYLHIKIFLTTEPT